MFTIRFTVVNLAETFTVQHGHEMPNLLHSFDVNINELFHYV